MRHRARTPEAKSERREQLLDAALDSFFKQGFAAARMEDIARRAGVSKGTLYLYFASKEDIFLAIIDSVARPRLESLEQIVDQSTGLLETLPQIMQLATHYVEHSPMPRIAKILIGEGNHFPTLLQEYRSRIIDRLLGALTRLIDQAGQRGEIVGVDPALTARLVVAPIIFSSLWQVTFGQHTKAPLDIPALLALHSDMLVRALSPKESSS